MVVYARMLAAGLVVGATMGCGTSPDTSPGPVALAGCTVTTLARPAVGDEFTTWDSLVIDPTGRYLAGTLSIPRPHRRVSFLRDLRTHRTTVIRTDGRVMAVNASGVLIAAGRPAWVYRGGRVTPLPAYLGRDMFPRGINARGDIVGEVEPDADNPGAPVIWPADRPVAVELLSPRATYNSTADAITEAGVIVGQLDTRPFVWTSPTVGHRLPTGVSEQLGGVTAAGGRQAVGYVFHDDDMALHPTSWDLTTGRPTAYPGLHELAGISATGIAIGDLVPAGRPDAGPTGALVDHGVIKRLPRPHFTAAATVRPPSPGAVAIDPDAATPTGITADGTTLVGLSVANLGGYSTSAAIWHC